MSKKLALFFTAIILLVNKNSFAQEKNKPFVDGLFMTELYLENNYDSNQTEYEYNQAYNRSYLNLDFNLNKNLFVKSLFRVEQSSAPNLTSHDKYFKKQSAYIEELSLNYENEKFGLGAGKLNNLNFGKTWYWLNNYTIWTSGISQANYRQNEKIGFKTNLNLGDEKKSGKYVFGLAVFTNDNKYLDNSKIDRRYSSYKTDGNPGDKRGLSSYIASLDINYLFGSDEKLSYHFSYLNLGVNDTSSPVSKAKIGDEKGFAFDVNYLFPFSSNLSLNPEFEYVNLENVGGNTDNKADFITANLNIFLYKDWNLMISRVNEKQFVAGGNGSDHVINEFNFGYRFNQNNFLKGLQLMAGYKRETITDKINPINIKSFGGMIRYTREF